MNFKSTVSATEEMSLNEWPGDRGISFNAPATPAISIITPCLNRADMIAEALASVAAQGRTDIEHLVMDGGSTDGTQAQVAAFRHAILVSGPDRNSHHAMNKGLALAKGEIIGFLNSDDLLGPGLLTQVIQYFAQHPQQNLVCCHALLFADAPSGRKILGKFIRPVESEDDYWAMLLFGAPGFNSFFFRRRLLGNGCDDRLQIAADRDLLIRLALAGQRPRHVLPAAYFYRQHPGSATIQPAQAFSLRQLMEHIRIADTLLRKCGSDAVAALRIRRWRAFERFQALHLAWRLRQWDVLAALAIKVALSVPVHLRPTYSLRKEFQRRYDSGEVR